MLPLLISGLGTVVDAIRCQEIFDYSTYEQEESVRYLVGMGQPMDYEPLMLAPSIPTMVWGGRYADGQGPRRRTRRDPRDLAAPGAGRDREHPDDGRVRGGHQGAVRFEVQGVVEGEPRIVIEHVTRIHPSCAPDWPQPPNGDGAIA